MKKQKSLIALLVCLALCLISMIGTWCGITDGGNVKVYDLSIDTNKGDVVRFLEYAPKPLPLKIPSRQSFTAPAMTARQKASV